MQQHKAFVQKHGKNPQRSAAPRWTARLVILLLAAAALVYLIQRIAARGEFAEFRTDRFWRNLASVQGTYLLLALALIYTSYFFRAVRWRAFLSPIKKAGIGNIFISTMIGFSAVSVIGRPGELVRPLLIARKEKVTLSSQLAAWTLERIFDSLALSMMMGLALMFLPASISGGHAALATQLRVGGAILCSASVVMVVLLLQLRRRSDAMMRILLWALRPLPERYRHKIQGVIVRGFGSFTEGLASIASASGFVLCVAYSAMVWLPVVAAFWSMVHAFGGAMAELGVGATIVLIVATVAGSLLQLPGIGGGPQIAAGLVLTQLFHIPLEIASTAAVVIWAIAFMAVMAVGVPLAAHEGLNWRRLRDFAKTGELDTEPPD